MRLYLRTAFTYLLAIAFLKVHAAPTAGPVARERLRQRIKRQEGGIIAMADSVSVVDVTADTATSLLVYRPSETASLELTSIPSPLNAPLAEATGVASAPSPALLSSDPPIVPLPAASSSSGDLAAASGTSQGSTGSNRIVAAGGSAAEPSTSQSSNAAQVRAFRLGSGAGGALALGMVGVLSAGLVGVGMI